MLSKIDLNCDMGELKPGQRANYDQQIMPYVTSCNVACGFHSGTPAIMEATIASALAHGVRVGAHPSYNDRTNFGRKSIDYDLDILLPELRYQISAALGMVESLGGRLYHVKPHGALYNDMVNDARLARAVVQLVESIDASLTIYGLAHSQVIDICDEVGIRSISEGFADRRYQSQKALRSRSLDDSVIHETEAVLQQVDSFINGQVQLYDNSIVPIEVQSICLHSDTEGAVALSEKIHSFIMDKSIAVE